MSIAAETQKALRSFRSLIDFARAAWFLIKDLKDLENGPTRAAIDIKVLKDLKRHRLPMANAGDRPPRYRKIETWRSLLPECIACIETGRSRLPGETASFGVSRNHFDNNEL